MKGGNSYPLDLGWSIQSPGGSVQLLSRVRLFATPWTTACQASLSITSSRSPPKPTSIKSAMPSNHLILCRPPLLLPSIFPSIGVFSNICNKPPQKLHVLKQQSSILSYVSVGHLGIRWYHLDLAELGTKLQQQACSVHLSSCFLMVMSESREGRHVA